MALWAAESDERQRAKRGLASNFAAPNFEKRQHGRREIRCLSPVCPSRTLTFKGVGWQDFSQTGGEGHQTTARARTPN
jgi:hypothetical protein